MTTVDVVCYKYKPPKNGELPLKIRICKDRKTRYINLGVSTKAEYWDFEKNQPKSACPDKEMLEKLIANKISEVKSKIVEMKSEDREFSATTLVEKVSNQSRIITVGELFKQHIHSLVEEKRTGYRLSIQQTYNSLIKFQVQQAPGYPFFRNGLHLAEKIRDLAEETRQVREHHWNKIPKY